jgi:hypothetical protein
MIAAGPMTDLPPPHFVEYDEDAPTGIPITWTLLMGKRSGVRYERIGPAVKLSDFPTKGSVWSIVANLGQRTVHPGSRLRVELYLSGQGRILDSKLLVYIPESLADFGPDPSGQRNLAYGGFHTTSGRVDGEPTQAPAFKEIAVPLRPGGVVLLLKSGFSLPRFGNVGDAPPPALERTSRLARRNGWTPTPR